MKKLKLLSTILVLVLVAALSVSCTKNYSSYIPKNAFLVGVIDGKSMKDWPKENYLAEMEEYKELIETLKQEKPKLTELLEKVQKNPNELGILLTKRAYIFENYENKELTVGFVIPINKKKLEANIELIDEDLGFSASDELKTINNITYYIEPDSGFIWGWKKDVFIFLGNLASGKVDFDLLEKHFNLKNSESILSNADFKKFHKNCKDLNLWLSFHFIKDVDEIAEEIKEFESQTNIDVANNYKHMHLECKKGQINFTSTLKYNKTIQELDVEKLYKNSEKFREIIDEMCTGILELLFPDEYNDHGYDDYEWEDYEWGDYEDDSTSVLPEYTDEEW